LTTPIRELPDATIPPHAGERRFGPLEQRNFLRWVYLGRSILATVLLVQLSLDRASAPDIAFYGLLFVVLAFTVTVYGFYVSFVRKRRAGLLFLFCHAATDLLLVTMLVHFGGARQSGWVALYVLVIAVYALLMPLRLSVLMGVVAAGLFLFDSFVLQDEPEGAWVWGQVVVFATIALVVAYLGQRLRAASAEHSELEIELRRVRMEADEILRSIRSGVMTVDGQGRLGFLNLAAEHLLGMSAAQWVGFPVLEELGRRSPELLEAVTSGIRKGRRVARGEGTALRADGRRVPIGLSTTTFVRPSEDLPSVTAIFTDISDLQQIQALHLRAERLEAVAALSASLAHEIRNPLASIRSSVEQLARVTREDPDERVLGDLIVRESDRLNRLLGEFLDFSRVRASHFETVDLSAIVRGAAQLVREHPDTGPGVEITVRGEPVEIEADEDLLHRICANLILNAAQAMNGAGRIEVIVDQPRPGELAGSGGGSADGIEYPVRLRVRDDGPGIDPDLMPRLFEPFVSGRPGGSGLGLAIVQRAVVAHRGFVTVESAPREGTTFTILLNRKRPSEEGA
jgi:two-component system sensor histidine kinase PilS (NtrC family)